ncbi:MAG: hypothetical protein M5U31_15215 [Acidimicrobiia bacterium]|nr:hypothetical protein [Acidimicrobiia bacterium]
MTEVALRLIPDHPYRVVALLGCADLETALAVARRLRHDVSALEALEGFFADGATLVSDSFGVVVPFDPLPPVLLLAEAAGARDPTDQLTAALNDLGDAVTDSAVAVDPAGRKTLWALRDRHTEAIAGQGIAHKLDVTLPPGRLALFEREVRALVGSFEPPSRCFLFGHVGDGNLHVNVVGPDPDDRRVDRAVLELAASMGGSISAEHGIGTAKRDLLALNRSPEERALFRSIRHAFDPAGILNPNVLIAD